MASILRESLATARMTLRPSSSVDFPRAFEIRQNWNVARNLSDADSPPNAKAMREWFAGHETEWHAGTSFRFAVELRGSMIGIVDINDVAEGEGELGYWFDERSWGHGYGFEAAERVVQFAFEAVALHRLVAGYVVDNSRSGRMLGRLGFVVTGDVRIFSKSRGTEVQQRRLEMLSPRR